MFFKGHVFIKINATWIILLLSFVARYLGVRFKRNVLKIDEFVSMNIPDLDLLSQQLNYIKTPIGVVRNILNKSRI